MVLNFYCRHISPTSDHQAWLGTPALHHSQANLTHDSGSSCSSINLLYMMHMASPFAGPGSKGFRCDKPHPHSKGMKSTLIIGVLHMSKQKRKSAKYVLLNGAALVTRFQNILTSIIHGLHMTLKSENSRIEIRI